MCNSAMAPCPFTIYFALPQLERLIIKLLRNLGAHKKDVEAWDPRQQLLWDCNWLWLCGLAHFNLNCILLLRTKTSNYDFVWHWSARQILIQCTSLIVLLSLPLQFFHITTIMWARYGSGRRTGASGDSSSFYG